MKEAVAKGVNVNDVRWGVSMLMLASSGGYKEVVKEAVGTWERM